MASWPTSLPQLALLEGYQEQAVDITLRSSVDVGPEKTRPRYTAAPVDFSVSLVLTSTQADALDAFYDSTLDFGTAPFDWQHPRTLAAASLTFRARPGYQALGGGLFRTSLSLRQWP